MVHQFKVATILLACMALSACGGGGSSKTNQSPRFAATASQTVDAGDVLTFVVVATDADGPAPLRMSILSSSPNLPIGFTFNDNGNGVGTFSWTPALADVGVYAVTFAATESGGTGKASTRLVNITVADPNAGNEAPMISSIGDRSATEGQPLTFMVNADDPDGPAPLTLTLSDSSPALPAAATFNDSGNGVGTFNWTPAAGAAGDYTVTFTAADGAGLTASQTITISVESANEAPIINPIGDQSVASGGLLTFMVTASDADGPAPLVTSLGASTPALPIAAVYTDNGDGTGNFSWQTLAADAGIYSVTFTATEAGGAGLSTDQTITIEVENQAPVQNPIGNQSVGSGELLTFTVTATDPDGPAPLEMRITGSTPALPGAALYTDNGNGTADFSWQTVSGDVGDYSVTFRATDGNGTGLFTEETITISVNNVAPVLNQILDQSELVGDLVSFGISATDPDGPGTLAMTIDSSVPALPPAAVLTDNGDGTADFDWTPLAADAGSYLVTFAATEDSGAGESDLQTMTIWVRANPAFTDDFEDGNANGWVVVNETNLASSWTVGGAVTRRQFRQNNFQGTKVADGGFDSVYHLGTFAYRPDLSLTDFRMDTTVELRSEFGEDCGVMWRYQDPDNYYRLSFNLRNGFTLIERKSGGTWTTLARNSRGLPPLLGVPVTDRIPVSVITQGPVIHIEVDGERVFAAHDTALDSGTVGVYARGQCGFDFVDVSPVDAAPVVAIAAPTDYSVDADLDIDVVAAVLNRPTNVGVEFALGGVPCAAASELAAGRFESTCSAPLPGTYALTADLFDDLALIDTNAHTTVGASGDHYASLGDSVADGAGFDNFVRDGSTSDGRVVSTQGFTSNLTESLSLQDPNRPHVVADYAAPSNRAFDVLDQLPGVLEQSPDSNRVLLLIGTNDSRDSVPAGTYRTQVQSIIDSAAAEGKEVWVSLVLPLMGPGAAFPPYSTDPENCDGDVPCPNQFVRDYNDVITNDLTGHNIGPDLYNYFLGAGENRITLYADSLHPNALGTAVLATLWHNSLTGETAQPYVLEGIELRLSEAGAPVNPLLYQQNLLEPGDEFLVDDNAELTGSVPAALQDGIWVMTANADVNASNTDYLTFDVGSDPVDVYLAYDAGAALPAALAAEFTDTGLDITTNHAGAATMNVYQRNSTATGTVVLDGADGGTTGADVNYLVIVVN